MTPVRHFTQADVVHFRCLRASGLSLLASAKAMGRSKGSVGGWAHRGCPIHDPNAPDIRVHRPTSPRSLELQRLREIAVAANIPTPPAPFIYDAAARAAQAAKPAEDRWPYPSPGYVERVLMPNRPATALLSAASC
jgi:hypothetical protein